ncbi:hypothetical protein [Actinomadura sp. DC4]|uniref:hypothetical protein n=1 Tax=Actinomadura sp. DC4 TaxID=3055069 RepID=UPI0025B14559|nr:hypothetical protein [Actinomadura sp. DC4]MDN3354079.1 hypothetical protein [Actinomadura sp. DC4]
MPGQRRPELSVTQLIAGAGATVTATVAASYFGVGGTLVGAGAVSVLSTAGATVYQHFLDRGKAQIAAKIPVRAGGAVGERESPSRTGRPWPKWYVLAGAAVGVFLAVMGLVTAFELVTGRPLADTVQGRAGGGTSVDPVRVPARPEPGPVATDEATPAPTPSDLTTPGRTPTPSPSGTPAAVPSPSTVGPASTPPRSPPADDDLDPLPTP